MCEAIFSGLDMTTAILTQTVYGQVQKISTSVCVYVYSLCVERHTCVEARSQSQMSFLRCW